MDNKKKAIIIVIIIIIGFFLIKNNSSEENEVQELTNNTVVTSSTSDETVEDVDATIKVHITGEVNNPGIIELVSGNRISDAIEVAGGVTSLADISKINLAYILSDGEKIYVPSVNDEEDVEFIVSQSSLNAKININTATLSQLQTLSGVGEATAQAIIDYRTKNGKYLTIEDIKNVSGIGDSKFEKIKDNICVK